MYVDESGNSDTGIAAGENNRFLCLTGVIFDLDYVNNTFSEDFESLKEKYFGKNADNPTILHRKDMINFRGRFGVLKNEEIQKNFNNELFSYLEKWQFSIISVLIDKKEIIETYGSLAKHPYNFCLEVLMEKYQIFLKDKSAVGDILIESRNKQDDYKLSQVYRNFYTKGTNFISGEEIREYLSSIEIKIKPKSANIAGLQIADLLVTNIRNRILVKYKLKPKDDPESFGNKLINLVIPKIYKHGTKYWGYGLKKIP